MSTKELLEHPPYSPDAAPRDFHLFGSLHKQWHFGIDAEVQQAVLTFLHDLVADFFLTGFDTSSVHRLNKCLDNQVIMLRSNMYQCLATLSISLNSRKKFLSQRAFTPSIKAR
ncbi:hypothetical protein AVEN_16041-1 [Araneus ventricosus]|uniref:Histone-lysine N-methyltransferase SETMAR n=1 Tax=Araneus ventricosus TaxID=182803 RepID=A0A4Y2UVA4_ARAVE|nr:hypothetical protein AVEN_16041-1 [Araneus ventricosus]